MTERHVNPEDFDLYALGALDGQDKVSFEAHVRSCVLCRRELHEAQRITMLLGLAEAPLAPSPSVKETLMRRVRAEKAESAQRAVQDRPRRASWGLRLTLASAFAALLLALAAGRLWRLDHLRQQEIAALQGELQSAQAQVSQNAATIRTVNEVIGAPDTVQLALLQQPAGPPGQAHILFNARMGVVIYSGEVAPAPADRSYQLWLVPSTGAPVSAGLVAANQSNQAVVVHLPPGLSAKAFAVTLEPHGGMPQPTGPKVLVGALNG